MIEILLPGGYQLRPDQRLRLGGELTGGQSPPGLPEKAAAPAREAAGEESQVPLHVPPPPPGPGAAQRPHQHRGVRPIGTAGGGINPIQRIFKNYALEKGAIWGANREKIEISRIKRGYHRRKTPVLGKFINGPVQNCEKHIFSSDFPKKRLIF